LFGVTAGQFVQELQAVKGKTLNLYLNSPGGDVFAGIAIYNALLRHDAAVNVTVDGVAASVASVVAQAGGTRIMSKASSMMIHDAWGMAIGPADEMEKMAGELNMASDDIAGIYAERAGGTAAEWRGRMTEETWYNAESAVASGLATGVAGSVPQAAYSRRLFNLSKFNKVPEWVNHTDTDEPPTQPSDTEEETNVSEINETALRAALGIDDEGDPIAAINALKAVAKDIATGEKGAENALRHELAEVRQAHLAATSDLTQELLTVRDRARQKEAAYAVDGAIQQGRVTPKDRDIALNLALNDADAFKKFASTLRVDLNERGAAVDAAMAAIEPTQDEVKIAASMGVSKEALMKQKAADQGIKLPA